MPSRPAPVSGAPTISSGVADLDDLLGGLLLGDNIVWVSDDASTVAPLEEVFLRASVRSDLPCSYVTTTDPPADVAARVGAEVTIYDARAGQAFADPMRLERSLVDDARSSPGGVVVDGLGALARRWGADRALALFSRVCPQLFDLGAVAYWRAPRRVLGARFLEEVRKVTQCVLEIDGHQLRVNKAEGRRRGAQGQIVRITLDDTGMPRLHEERALGRLARGLARVREQRQLTQAEVARLAGVSASAISQAEAGRRGLSLDTVVGLADQLQVSVDTLLGHDPDAGYVLARRDRAGPPSQHTPLLDDPAVGLRAHLIHLRAGEAGAPHLPHKGLELVVGAFGLVQLDLGSDMPVIRAGDAVLASKVHVRGWRNLLAEPARLVWVLRD